jgi:hypothetical protein
MILELARVVNEWEQPRVVRSKLSGGKDPTKVGTLKAGWRLATLYREAPRGKDPTEVGTPKAECRLNQIVFALINC